MPQDDCLLCEQGPSAPSNPLLCTDCQAWNDLYHITDCLADEYPGIDPEIFSHESGVRGYYKKVYNAGLDTLEFRPLDSLSPPKGCLVCAEIQRTIYDSMSDDEEKMGWKLAIWRPFRFLGQSSRASKNEEGSQTAIEIGDTGDKQDITGTLIVPVCISSTSTSDDKPRYITRLLELDLHYNDPHGYDLRSVTHWDRTKIDIGVVRRWLADCQRDHGPNCNTLVTPLSLPPHFRLIDTHEWCVVAAQEPVEFVALSYIWSAAISSTASSAEEPLQLDTRTLKKLEEKSSLKTAGLPELIADTLALCADIGYHYLWVDRLCVVQDAGEMKMEQINAMDAIYHKAVLTIVALGDGGSGSNRSIGLPGSSTRPRQVTLDHKPWILSIDGIVTGVHAPGIHSAVSTSPWNGRGWTYQERVLSRRHLFIDKDHFYLNCTRDTHDSDEYYVHKTKRHMNAPMGGGGSDNGYERGISRRTASPDWYDPGISRYASAVREYTARKLSFDSDSLNAFLGVGRLLAAQKKTKLLFGLPEKYLFQALLWRHTGSSFRLRDIPSESSSIPSWSWAAWEGPVDYDDARWHFGDTAYEVSPNSEAHVGNLVKLYYVDPSMNYRAGAVRPVEEVRLWFQRRGMEGSATGEELPSRWTEIISGMSAHRHLSLDGDKALEMWRDCIHSPWEALQHAEINDFGSLANVPPGSLIFNTTKATLTVEERLLSADSSSEWREESQDPNVRMSLVDKKGNVVGQVLPMSRDETLKTFRSGEKYGVMVIGACITTKTGRSGKDPWGLIVLIVREEGGISRRVALGAVNPRAWTDLRPQWETVVLA